MDFFMHNIMHVSVTQVILLLSYVIANELFMMCVSLSFFFKKWVLVIKEEKEKNQERNNNVIIHFSRHNDYTAVH